MSKSKYKKTYNPKNLKGMSIYQEEKRTVYSPFYTSKGYIISNSLCRAYDNYVQGYLIALFIFALSYIITRSFLISLGLGLAFFIGTVISFYINFIKKAAVIPDYRKPEMDNFFVRQAKSLDYRNIWTIIICCFLLSLVILLNGYANKFEGSYKILNDILAVVSLIYGLMHIYILVYKKKNVD